MIKPLHFGMHTRSILRIILPLALGVATLSEAAWGATKPVKLAPNAPDVYVVRKGDTLWDISQKFTRETWRWPELWRMNRGQVRNPHLIYPGQRILLDRSGPYLRTDGKLEPKMYVGPVSDATPTIPRHVIEPFIISPTVVEQDVLEGAGTVVAGDLHQINSSVGEEIFAKDVAPNVEEWQIFRPLRPITDPVTKTVLAYEGTHVGSAKVIARTHPVTLEVIASRAEINAGDRLLPATKPALFAYAPHAPEKPVSARIVAIHDRESEAALRSVIVLNVGSNDGMDEGTVLALYRNRGVERFTDNVTTKTYPLAAELNPGEDLPVIKREEITEDYALPSKRTGLAMVFKATPRVSYAIIMEAQYALKVGDEAREP